MNRATRYLNPCFRRPQLPASHTYSLRVLYQCTHIVRENIVAGSSREALIVARELAELPCRNCSGLTCK